MILFYNQPEEQFEIQLMVLNASFPDKVKFDKAVSGNEEVIVASSVADATDALDKNPTARILMVVEDLMNIDPREAMALAHKGITDIIEVNKTDELVHAISENYSKKKDFLFSIRQEPAPKFEMQAGFLQVDGFKNQYIVGQSEAIKDCLTVMASFSRYNEDILVTGANGTGKGVHVAALMDNLQRKKQITFNIAEINSELFASRLFGYKKGSFTGADKDTEGLLKAADKGVLFIDEIGELSLQDQAKLLRVYQEREFLVIGETKPTKIDLQIIAATNQPLGEMVKKGTFREDLYYRINNMNIQIPSLKERAEDIPMIIKNVLNKLNARYPDNQKEISTKAVSLLAKGDWPGNVRQLEAVVKNLHVREKSKMITLDTTIQFLQASKDFSAELLKSMKGKLDETVENTVNNEQKVHLQM